MRYHNYSSKTEVIYETILLPVHAPACYTDRQTLWNAVEKVECNCNAQQARKIQIAIPVEIPAEQFRSVITEYCQKEFVDKRMCCDIAIHDKGDGYPHAHILLTMRALDKDGNWLAKSRKEYILDEDGRYWVRVPWKKGAIRKTTLKAVEQEILKHFKEGIPTLNSIYVEYKQFRLLQIKPATFRKDVKNFENYIQHSPIGNKPISELTIKDGYQWYLYCKKEKPDMKEKYFNNVKDTLNSLMNYAIDNQIIKSNPFEKLKIDPDQFVPPT